jgi:hypothetical protein
MSNYFTDSKKEVKEETKDRSSRNESDAKVKQSIATYDPGYVPSEYGGNSNLKSTIVKNVDIDDGSYEKLPDGSSHREFKTLQKDDSNSKESLILPRKKQKLKIKPKEALTKTTPERMADVKLPDINEYSRSHQS